MLVDPARGGGTLGALSSALAPELKVTKDAILKQHGIHEDSPIKMNLTNRFSFYKQLQDEKILVFPDAEEMHTTPDYATTWV